MKTSEVFDGLLANLKVGDTATTVSSRRDEITKSLNKDFRSKDGDTAHKLMVGSYGRHTAIKGVSDLDMIYILPPSIRDDYASESGPRRVLERVRNDLKARYSNTDIRVDQCVVRVQFQSNAFKFEVQPAFANADGSFDYPDTATGSWKVTKPRAEIEATRACNGRTSTNMRHLARMARAWKNANGVGMGGLLIDTLVHRFFAQTNEYDSTGTGSFDLMVRDFFRFLMEEPDKDFYLALGSNQRVKVKARFQPKAKKAYNRCLQAITDEGKASANRKWREIFGRSLPLEAVVESARSFDNTEEFVEQKYPIDIRYTLTIDCTVTQNGWRPTSLREMLRASTLLLPNKGLDFTITACDVPDVYDVRWKVLNQGDEAERRNMIRGQIVEPNRANGRHESTSFRGKHLVECYAIQDGIVVARDRIDVPISATARNAT
ncbi:nucleotidyltransferase [Rhodococcus sp. 06-235-1A]|uniref:nucleotide-binding domain-containing protein n=1 Tax=Rhodococcus sp. 06-235-1A TaxID=2022508 RepID=UPI000B9BDF91|nr:nucleotidyltransferase [Rhodococcus sp. 06-235-1A]OZD01188.1 nucleotidyltransferase [Rhodococcus sp. 06-235-1A]